LTGITEIGEDSGSIDEFRRLEVIQNHVHREEVSLETSKSEAVGNNGGHVEKNFKTFPPIPDASKHRFKSRK
jgi:hypothetical protein